MTTYSIQPAGGSSPTETGLGSKDGTGSGDHDEAYTFGRRPRVVAPFPFTHLQFARLLTLRGRVADGLTGSDDIDAAGQARTSSAEAENARQPTLFYRCESCGAMVPGRHHAATRVACFRCTREVDYDVVVRAILRTAGVLDDADVSRPEE
jgi:hypothetical protein